MIPKLVSDEDKKAYKKRLKLSITKGKSLCEECIATALRRISLKETSPMIRDNYMIAMAKLDESLAWYIIAKNFFRKDNLQQAEKAYIKAKSLFYAE